MGRKLKNAPQNKKPAAKITKIAAVAALTSTSLLLTGCFGIGDAIRAISNVKKQNSEGTLTVDDTDYAKQNPDWFSCDTDIECALINAPLDWENQDSGESIQLALAKLPATGTAKGTIFVNPGGPGALGTDYVMNAADKFSSLRENFDIIGWDPRGVGNSTPVECLDGTEMDEMLYGNEEHAEEGSQEWLDEVASENKEYGQKCFENSGQLINHVSTADTVHDLDLLRQIVGDDKLNYLGFSYGTYIGALYADKYPEKVGHLVLDGALNPESDTAEVVAAQTKGFELALKNYLQDCVNRGCWYEGDVNAGLEKIKNILAELADKPLEAADGRWVTTSVFVTALVTPLYSQDSWSFLDDLFKETSAGKTDTALFLADFYYDRSGKGEYANNSTQAFQAINCADYASVTPDLEKMRKGYEELSKQAPILGPYQGYADASCWGWPAENEPTKKSVQGTGADPIVVVGTINDPATPYAWAEELADMLDSGVLLTYDGEGHTAYGAGSSCIDTAVEEYFTTGQVPAENTVCKAD